MEISNHLEPFNPNLKKERNAPIQKAIINNTQLNLHNWEVDDKLQNGERDYEYEELVKLIYDELNSTNKLSTGKSTKSLPVPSIAKDGGKHTVWLNFGKSCQILNRPEEHIKTFMFVELNTSCDIGDNGKLTIKGIYNAKAIENIMRKYITEYVTCSICQSLDTVLKKENRITFKICNFCKSSSSVANIIVGFKSSTK